MTTEQKQAIEAMRRAYHLQPGTTFVPVAEELIGQVAEPVCIELYASPHPGLAEMLITTLSDQ